MILVALAACSVGPREGDVETLVAARDLPKGHVVTEDDLDVIWFPDDVLESEVAQREQALGLALPEALYAGEIVLRARLLGHSPTPADVDERDLPGAVAALGPQSQDVADAWRVDGEGACRLGTVRIVQTFRGLATSGEVAVQEAIEHTPAEAVVWTLRSPSLDPAGARCGGTP